MTTYAELEFAIADAQSQLVSAMQRAKTGKVQIGQSNTTISGLGAQYSAIVTAINSLATAEPGNAAVQALKARKDRLVADFQTVSANIAAMVSGLDGLDPS